MTAPCRGQSSLELLLIFAVAMFVLTTAIVLSSGQLGTISSLKEQDDAMNSVQDISAAAQDVYSQGEGARKQVYVFLPSSYEPSESRIGNRSLVLRVRGTDYAAPEDFDVHGSWPGDPGGHWVWVISEGSTVRIGTAMLALSKNHISIIMNPNETAYSSFYVESLWDSDIGVESSLQWTPAEVVASDDVGSFQLTPGQTRQVNLQFTSGPSSVGYYNGELLFTASEGGVSETLRLPMTVEVAGYRPSSAPPLNVSPDFWAGTLAPGDNLTKAFQVCTNQQSFPSSVTFTPSGVAPGEWIGGTDPFGPMEGGECRIKILSLTVPNTTVDGTYSGSIEVVGEGAPGAQETISLFFTVEGSGDTCAFSLDNQSMCNCPVGAEYWDVPLCQCKPANIYVLNGTIVGGDWDGLPYNGTLVGGSSSSIISGTDGNDIIHSGTSGDLICGQDGDDILYGGNGVDFLDGGPGADTLYGGAAEDRLYGKEGNDLIYGDAGADQIDGGGNDDVIYAGDQADTVYGGPGNDQIHGDNQDDVLCGNSGDDTLFGEDGKDDLDGGTGINALDGGTDNNDCYNGIIVNCTAVSGYYPTCGPS